MSLLGKSEYVGMSERFRGSCGASETEKIRKRWSKKQANRVSFCARAIQNVIIVMDQAMIPGVHVTKMRLSSVIITFVERFVRSSNPSFHLNTNSLTRFDDRRLLTTFSHPPPSLLVGEAESVPTDEG